MLAPLIISLVYPLASHIIAVGIFTGRFLFTIGYATKGPDGRLVGAITMDIALFVGFGFLVAAMISLGK